MPAHAARSLQTLLPTLTLGLLLVAGTPGCAPTNVTVTGTVLQGGQPLVQSPTGRILVTLVPDVPGGSGNNSSVGYPDATGKFEVLNVPRGKYRVVIEQFDPNPMTDKLAGAFSLAKTKLTCVVDGKTPVVIDLATP